MPKLLLPLLWLLALAGPALSQSANPAYRLDRMLGTPVSGPRDLGLDRAGNMYLLDGPVNKLDPQGRYLTGFSVTSTLTTNGYAYSMAVDGDGTIYVANYATGTGDFIRKYDNTGRLLLQFGTAGRGAGQMLYVESICVGPDGTIYVADNGNRRLQAFSPQGVPLFAYALPTANGSDLKDVTLDAAGTIYLLEDYGAVTKVGANGQLLGRLQLSSSGSSGSQHECLLVEPNGDLLVSSTQDQLLRYSPTGALRGRITSNGYVSSSTHTAMALNAAGEIFATVFTHQQFGDRLFKFSPQGTELARWGNAASLSTVRLDDAGNSYTLNGSTNEVEKRSPSGQRLLAFRPAMSGSRLPLTALDLDGQGNIYLLGTTNDSASIRKYGPRGQFLRDFRIHTQGYHLMSGLAVGRDGSMYVSDYYGCVIRRLSPQGAVLSPIGGRGTGPGQLYIPKAVAVDQAGNVYAADYDGKRVQKFSPAGQVLQQYGPSASGPNPTVTMCEADLAVDGRGNVYLSSTVHAGFIYPADGSSASPMPAFASRIAVNRRGSRLLTMQYGNDLIRCFTSTQVAPENLITGQIFNDVNFDCQPGATEQPLAGIVVVAEPGEYYGVTDENGGYVIAADTGTYTVHQLLPPAEDGRVLQQSCASQLAVTFRGYNNMATDVNFGDQASIAPFLRVSVGANRRRRCARNVTSISYANTGFAPAPGAVVRVALPPQVVFLSANAPHTLDARGRYVFQLGTLAAGAAGHIIIQDSVKCGDPGMSGLTVCTQAWIAPANVPPTPPGWNGASAIVSGQPQPGNVVRFVLRNAGTGSMTDSLALRLYQNTDLALQHRYRLAAGDSLVLRVPASRPVLRLEAEQPAQHPLQRLASATVELPALGTPGQPNPAMTAMPPNALGPQQAEDCQPIVDSFDPNDKLVLPTGVTAQHYTPTGVPLQYRVRFQNTGTDDAYRVEVVDTLAANLDPRTLRIEAASHPYRLSVTGHGRPVLTFTFENINLPPSTRNEPASNGFVLFSIRPRAGLPPRAQIDNYADIFFDYNPPVRTNTTVNRIYDLPPVPEPAVALPLAAVLASPVLEQVAPAQGRFGATVTLSGQRFDPAPGANRVLFNGVAAPVLQASATTLIVRVPAGASSGTVQVITGEGGARSAQSFTVHQPPTLTTLTPAEGVPGSLVTLGGTHFATLAAHDTVWFGGVPALVQQARATALTVVVPATAPTGRVRLSTLGGTAESPQEFVVWYPPTITRFSPARGKAGTVVTLEGSNFGPATRNEVSFGPVAATVLQASATTLQVRVPAGAGTGPLGLRTPGGPVQSAASFTFLPAPVITSFAPTQGTVGEVLTLTGENFLLDGLADTIYVNGVRAAVLAATPTSATVRVPFGASTGPLLMAGVGGQGSSATAFTVRSLAPAEALEVYPNPAPGRLTLNWQRADFVVEQVRVYDAVGTLVQTLTPPAATSPALPLDLGGQRAGLYLLVLRTSRGTVTKHFTLY